MVEGDARRLRRELDGAPGGEPAVVVHRGRAAAVLVVDVLDQEVELGGHLDHLAQRLGGLLGRDVVAVAGDRHDVADVADRVLVVVAAAASLPLELDELLVEHPLPAALDGDAVEVDEQGEAVALAHVGDLDVLGGLVLGHWAFSSSLKGTID